MFRPVIVIPVFQHGDVLNDTVAHVSALKIPLIVVNDGSNAEHSLLIGEVCRGERIKLLTREFNGGKGAAVIDGLREAIRQGYTHVFQIDADGQHDLSCIPKFIKMAGQYSNAMILGYPCYDRSVPLSRQVGRWFTHIFVWLNSLSFSVRDSMCGFRVFPALPVLQIVEKVNVGQHMEFDSEICVRACWAGLATINLPVGVVYPDGGKSNFRIKEDNILISLMHMRLFFGMLIRFPILLLMRIRETLFNQY